MSDLQMELLLPPYEKARMHLLRKLMKILPMPKQEIKWCLEDLGWALMHTGQDWANVYFPPWTADNLSLNGLGYKKLRKRPVNSGLLASLVEEVDYYMFSNDSARYSAEFTEFIQKLEESYMGKMAQYLFLNPRTPLLASPAGGQEGSSNTAGLHDYPAATSHSRFRDESSEEEEDIVGICDAPEPPCIPETDVPVDLSPLLNRAGAGLAGLSLSASVALLGHVEGDAERRAGKRAQSAPEDAPQVNKAAKCRDNVSARQPATFEEAAEKVSDCSAITHSLANNTSPVFNLPNVAEFDKFNSTAAAVASYVRTEENETTSQHAPATPVALAERTMGFPVGQSQRKSTSSSLSQLVDYELRLSFSAYLEKEHKVRTVRDLCNAAGVTIPIFGLIKDAAEDPCSILLWPIAQTLAERTVEKADEELIEIRLQLLGRRDGLLLQSYLESALWTYRRVK